MQKFSRILRFVLEYAEQSWVSLDNEITFLNDYLLLEQMRFNNSFDYSIDVDKDEDLSNTWIPPFFIQPKIENALKHGIRGLFERGKIIVSIKVIDQFIMVSIKDNGIGREVSKQKKVYSDKNTNKGFELTKKRMNQLKTLGYESSLEIIDLYKGKDAAGTEIILKLPRKSNKSVNV